MKLLKKHINLKDGTGYVKLQAEDPDDMWHIYNLIHKYDSIRTTTIRKVVKEGVTGSTSTQRIRLHLTIEVEAVDFDPILCVLRIKGKNINESEYVKMGAYHTIELEMNRDFTLTKNSWDIITIERLKEACDFEKQADLAAVIMQTGLAHLCLIKGNMTIIKSKIEMTIPKKRTGSTAHATGIKKFYEMIVQAIKRHIDFTLVKSVILASPGFLKDDLYKYLNENANRQNDRLLMDNKSKFTLIHASSGYKHALDEVLLDPSIQNKILDSKVSLDVKLLNKFFEMLHTNMERAYYGYHHIIKANALHAIETLLLSDELFRNNDINIRKKYVALVESVRENEGDVRLFSSLHTSGEQLSQVGGIAAILKYPIPEIEDLDENQDEDGDDDEKYNENGNTYSTQSNKIKSKEKTEKFELDLLKNEIEHLDELSTTDINDTFFI